MLWSGLVLFGAVEDIVRTNDSYVSEDVIHCIPLWLSYKGPTTRIDIRYK